MAGLIVEMLLLRNGLKMSEYKAYWLMNFPLINIWAHVNKESCGVHYKFLKSKQTSARTELGIECPLEYLPVWVTTFAS